MLSECLIAKRRWIPAVGDGVRIRDRVVRIAVISKVNLSNSFLHGTDKCWKRAETVFILFAAFDARHWKNSVIENESDMSGILRCWAR